jgi:hypothetical protein
MTTKALKPFLFLMAVITMVSLACMGGSGTSSPEPVDVTESQPQQIEGSPQPIVVTVLVTEKPDIEEPTQPPDNTKGGFVTFTDANGLYSIEVPADWTYEQSVDTENNNYYIDTFTAPDGGAVIENIVYDDGTVFTGNQKSKFALYLLNTFYSSTGREGDIRVSDDAIMKDGSERLTWTSKGGGYSGISFLEVRRNDTTFLFFTVDWGNSVEETYRDILNYVIESYTIP